MPSPTLTPTSISPFERKIQIGFFGIYVGISAMLLFYINLITLKLNGHNAYSKKILYLFYFLVNYILAHVAFKHINPILSQGSPIVLMYLINKYFGDVVVMGLTGGIACGKSTLVDGLKRKFDLQIIDCDEISRTVSLPGEKGYNFILNALGDQKNEFIERATGMIKRDKLGELTFRDREFRNKLTKGLGKFIFIEIAKRLLKAVLTGHKFILIDAPILFQTKVLTYICYPIIVVYLEQQQQIKRLTQRNNYTRDEAISRIKSQMPIEEKIARGNICVNNIGTKQELVKSCEDALEKFLKKVRQS